MTVLRALWSVSKVLLDGIGYLCLAFIGQILILLSVIVLLAVPIMGWADWTALNTVIVAIALAVHFLGWYLYFRL